MPFFALQIVNCFCDFTCYFADMEEHIESSDISAEQLSAIRVHVSSEGQFVCPVSLALSASADEDSSFLISAMSAKQHGACSSSSISGAARSSEQDSAVRLMYCKEGDPRLIVQTRGQFHKAV